MKVIMVMVSTLNGKITNGDDPNIYTWTSKEDKNYFFSLLKKNRVVVMGSNTYNAVKDKIQLRRNLLRIVFTRNLRKYSREIIPKQLEFISNSPKQLVKNLKERGYKKILIVGGGKVNSSFLKTGLVDEFYLTLEPKIFGEGKALFEEGAFENKLQLISVKKLNKKGTLLLKYKLLK